jgi:tRNA threonylcarbamoyladenosine biosynthesis protein TsaB
MRLLAIDTALEACTAAVLDADGSRTIRSRVIGRGHGEALFPMIRDAMAEAGIGLEALERIAVVTGPGSFTGLRIGIAAARAFALVRATPVVGLSTLAIHAHGAAPACAPILALQEGRGDEAFGQLFDSGGDPVGEPACAPRGHWAALAAGKGAILCGSGADGVAALMADAPAIVHRNSAPDPDALIDLAAAAALTAGPVRPLYLKAPDATPRTAS